MKNKSLLVIVLCSLLCFQAQGCLSPGSDVSIDYFSLDDLSDEDYDETSDPDYWFQDKELVELGNKFLSLQKTLNPQRHVTKKIEQNTTIELIHHDPRLSFKPIKDLFKKLKTENFHNKPNRYLIFSAPKHFNRTEKTIGNLKSFLRLSCKYPKQVLRIYPFFWSLVPQEPHDLFLQIVSYSQRLPSHIDRLLSYVRINSKPMRLTFKTEKASLSIGNVGHLCLKKAKHLRALFNPSISLPNPNTAEPPDQAGFFLLNKEKETKKWNPKVNSSYINQLKDETNQVFANLAPFRYKKTDEKSPGIATRTILKLARNVELWKIEQKFLVEGEEEKPGEQQKRLEFMTKKIPVLKMIMAKKES